MESTPNSQAELRTVTASQASFDVVCISRTPRSELGCLVPYAEYFALRPAKSSSGRAAAPVGSEDLWVVKKHIGPSMPGGTRRWLGWVGPKVGRGRSKTAGAVNSGGMDRKSGSSRRVDGTVTTLTGSTPFSRTVESGTDLLGEGVEPSVHWSMHLEYADHVKPRKRTHYFQHPDPRKLLILHETRHPDSRGRVHGVQGVAGSSRAANGAGHSPKGDPRDERGSPEATAAPSGRPD